MRIEVIALHLDHVENSSDASDEHIVEMNAVGRAAFLTQNDLHHHLLLRDGMCTLEIRDLQTKGTWNK